MLRAWLVDQLERPTGWLGRAVFGPLMNVSHAPTNRAVCDLMGLSAGDHVLEVGIGGGDLVARLLRELIAGRVTGVDLSPDALAAVRQRQRVAVLAERLRLIEADAAALPFDDGQFDAVAMVHTLYFAEVPEAVAHELARVVRPGGRVVVAVAAPADAVRAGLDGRRHTLLEEGEVVALLAEAGLDHVRTEIHREAGGRVVCVLAKRPTH